MSVELRSFSGRVDLSDNHSVVIRFLPSSIIDVDREDETESEW